MIYVCRFWQVLVLFLLAVVAVELTESQHCDLLEGPNICKASES